MKLCYTVSKPLIAVELSARRSDAVSERGLALGSRRHLKAKSLPHEGVFGRKKPPKKEPRAKCCIMRLPVLYYKPSSLNDFGFPTGIETPIVCPLRVEQKGV